jgi:hypothetical protein
VKKPLATVVGALLMVARTISGVIVILVAGLTWRDYARSLMKDARIEDSFATEGDAGALLAFVLGAYGFALVLYLLLALFVYLGHNWARIVAMAFATVSIIVAYTDYLHNGVQITLRTTLASLALDILILLALSSTPARLYARRPRPVKVRRQRWSRRRGVPARTQSSF